MAVNREPSTPEGCCCNRRIKVLINALSAVQGGGQTYLINLLKRVEGYPEFEFLVVTSRDIYQTFEDIEGVNFHIVSFSYQNLFRRTLWEIFSMPRLAKNEGVDLLFCPGGILYSRGKGYKAAVTFQNLLPLIREERRSKYLSLKQKIRLTLLRALFLWSFRRADLVIFLHEYSKAMVAKRLGRKERMEAVIPHGLDDDFRTFRRGDANRPPYLPAEDYILYVSVVNHYKAHLEVVEAFRLLCEIRETPEKLLLVGPDGSKYAAAVRDAIRKMGLEGKVVMTGKRPYQEMPSIYAHSKAIIFASRCENFPNVVLESLGAGKPVLVSRISPMPEIAGDAALYFDPDNPAELARLLATILDNGQLMKEMGERAWQRSFSFSWDEVADRIFRCFALLCNTPLIRG